MREKKCNKIPLQLIPFPFHHACRCGMEILYSAMYNKNSSPVDSVLLLSSHFHIPPLTYVSTCVPPATKIPLHLIPLNSFPFRSISTATYVRTQLSAPFRPPSFLLRRPGCICVHGAFLCLHARIVQFVLRSRDQYS